MTSAGGVPPQTARYGLLLRLFAGVREALRPVGSATVVLLTTAGCGLVGPEDDTDLERAQETWSAAAIESYTYVVERGCFCAPDALGPVHLGVRDGRVTTAVYVESGLPVERFADLFPSVEGLFELIRDAMERGAHRVDVTYDAALGFPTVIDIDYIENAIDDELTVWARDLRPSP